MFSPHKAFPPGPGKIFPRVKRAKAGTRWPRDGSSAKFCGPQQGRSPRQCGRSRRPGKRLEYAKRLEQVERLKAEERMKNPVENFPQGEAGITPRMREKLPSGNISLGSKGSPPRMREKLPFVAYGNVSGSDHPRACGKNACGVKG